MYDQEVSHLRAFERIMPERRVRPTALLPVWHVAGYALGMGTAFLGERAAMAATVAVEEVISEHYNDQLRTLNEPSHADETHLRALIKRHRDEEEEHRDIGYAHDATSAPLYSLLTNVIKAGCRTAIWLSSRI